jgi:hypothetical protein
MAAGSRSTPTPWTLVASGRMDPELLRMQIAHRVSARAERFVAARFEPVAAHRSQAAPFPGAVVNPLGPPTFSGRRSRSTSRCRTRRGSDADGARPDASAVLRGPRVRLGRRRDRWCGHLRRRRLPRLYADRDVQRVEPGTEFPIVAFSRRAPAAAVVEKWGGKFYFVDEARDRNEITEFTKAMRQLSNTIVRKINQRGVQILEAFITANSRTVTGVSWGSVNTTYAAGSNWPLFPARDFAKADLIAEQEEMDMDYNLWILNPNEMFNLEGIYGDKLGALLDSYDIDIFVTNRITAGTAYAVAEGQVGEMRSSSRSRRRRGATRTASSRPGSSRPSGR